MDAWLLKTISENWMTISFVYVILKGIAMLTPSVKDDQIVTMIGQALNVIKRGRK